MSKFKIGDRVKAVQSHVDITIGRVYPVVDVNAAGDVAIKDDALQKHWRTQDFFELFNDKYLVINGLHFVVDSYEEAVAKVKQFAEENPGVAFTVAPAAGAESYQLVTSVQRIA